jgi:hypothetical protein
MTKATRPNDGRLKANRDFSRFMLRAVHMPSMARAQGKFAVDPVIEIVERPTDFYDAYSESQLADALYRTLSFTPTKRSIEFSREIAAALYWRYFDSQREI